MAQNYNFPTALRGDTFNRIEFTVADADDNPIDLTGVNIYMFLKLKVSQGVKEAQFTVGNGFTIIDAPNGRFDFDEKIIKENASEYKYDIQFFFPDGSTKTYLEGSWKIAQDVTD
ncbi:MAG: hypothetical protein S4CHLAM20_04460 [Chlamydiia bacterium]|nr:hypothetical protein [Chlamydiia bacterium]